MPFENSKEPWFHDALLHPTIDSYYRFRRDFRKDIPLCFIPMDVAPLHKTNARHGHIILDNDRCLVDEQRSPLCLPTYPHRHLETYQP